MAPGRRHCLASFNHNTFADPILIQHALFSSPSQYSGVVNAKAVGIEAAKTGKGVILTTKNSKQGAGAIKKTTNSATLKKGGGRRASGIVSNVVAKRGYRADLTRGTFFDYTNITKRWSWSMDRGGAVKADRRIVCRLEGRLAWRSHCNALEPTRYRHEGLGVIAMQDPSRRLGGVASACFSRGSCSFSSAAGSPMLCCSSGVVRLPDAHLLSDGIVGLVTAITCVDVGGLLTPPAQNSSMLTYLSHCHFCEKQPPSSAPRLSSAPSVAASSPLPARPAALAPARSSRSRSPSPKRAALPRLA